MASRAQREHPCLRRGHRWLVEQYLDSSGRLRPFRVGVWLAPCHHLFRFERRRVHNGAAPGRDYYPCDDCALAQGRDPAAPVHPINLRRNLKAAVEDPHRLNALVALHETFLSLLSKPQEYLLAHELRAAAERHMRQAGLLDYAGDE
jgi:hypothetical protein